MSCRLGGGGGEAHLRDKYLILCTSHVGSNVSRKSRQNLVGAEKEGEFFFSESWGQDAQEPTSESPKSFRLQFLGCTGADITSSDFYRLRKKYTERSALVRGSEQAL